MKTIDIIKTVYWMLGGTPNFKAETDKAFKTTWFFHPTKRGKKTHSIIELLTSCSDSRLKDRLKYDTFGDGLILPHSSMGLLEETRDALIHNATYDEFRWISLLTLVNKWYYLIKRVYQHRLTPKEQMSFALYWVLLKNSVLNAFELALKEQRGGFMPHYGTVRDIQTLIQYSFGTDRNPITVGFDWRNAEHPLNMHSSKEKNSFWYNLSQQYEYCLRKLQQS